MKPRDISPHMRAQRWDMYVCEYGPPGEDVSYAWCFRCGVRLEIDDVDSHRMIHLLREAP